MDFSVCVCCKIEEMCCNPRNVLSFIAIKIPLLTINNNNSNNNGIPFDTKPIGKK